MWTVDWYQCKVSWLVLPPLRKLLPFHLLLLPTIVVQKLVATTSNTRDSTGSTICCILLLYYIVRILQVVDEDDLGLYSAIREHFLRVVLLCRRPSSRIHKTTWCSKSPFPIFTIHSPADTNLRILVLISLENL